MTVVQQERLAVRLLYLSGLVGTALWCGGLVGIGWTIAKWVNGQ